MLISPAYAQGAGGMDGMAAQILPIVLIIGVFYFLIIRPQQKKQKDHQEMVGSMKKGDRVVTAGGIHGVLIGTKNNIAVIKISENTKIEINRSAISSVESKK